jgi:transposase
MRDLERARDDAKRAERVARNQLSKFLLRHGRRFEGKTSWTRQHYRWLSTQTFEHPAQQRVLADYLKTAQDIEQRVTQLTKSMEELVETWDLKPVVRALQALRGVGLVSAVVLVAEIENFARFDRAAKFMAYTGLVPSERSSGEERRQGRITGTGNRHVRRILVEAAWAYRFRPGLSLAIRRRSQGLAPGVLRIAAKAQARLHERFHRLVARGKHANKVITAVARELAAFVWAIAREERLLDQP